MAGTERHLSPASRVTRTDGVIEAEIDNEIVALSIERGTCYGMNAVASRIWHVLQNPITVDEICKTLIAEYAVDRSVCEQQVLDLLEDLRAEGLIRNVEPK